MSEEIKRNGVTHAIVHRKADWSEGLNFLTADEMFLQVGTWWYKEGEILGAHRHIENRRYNKITQECIIVVEGKLRVDLYDPEGCFHTVILRGGDLMIMVAGGHGYEILEDNTKVIECKNGPFVSVEKDKVAI